MLPLGRYSLAALETGSFAPDGGALFGAVPRPEWERLHRPDERHRVHLAARALLVVDTLSERRVLVDDGMGSRWGGERADRLAVESRGVEAALARHGLAPADVTDVILTHLHPSHAGGTLRPGAGGRPELA